MFNFGLQILDSKQEEIDCFMESFDNQNDLIAWWLEQCEDAEYPNWHFCIFWRADLECANKKLLKRGFKKIYPIQDLD